MKILRENSLTCLSIFCKAAIVLAAFTVGIQKSFANEIDSATDKISKCLRNANGITEKEIKCIGLIYDSCTGSAGRSTLSGMIECENIEYRAWDVNLNHMYDKVIKLSSQNVKIYIKKSKIKWLEYRDRNCEWPTFVYPKGTMQKPLILNCLRNETAHRTIFLSNVATRLLEMGN